MVLGYSYTAAFFIFNICYKKSGDYYSVIPVSHFRTKLLLLMDSAQWHRNLQRGFECDSEVDE